MRWFIVGNKPSFEPLAEGRQMKLYFTSQDKNLSRHLELLITKEVMHYKKELLPEKTTTIEVNSKKNLCTIASEVLYNYRIFPPAIMTFRTQWHHENRDLKPGDTIVQQVFIPPIKAFSQKIIFGVRILSIIDEPHRKGFSYATLEGHVEKGESLFTIEKLNDQKLIFKIQTYSVPANPFVKNFASWFAVPYQTYSTRQALENVKRQIEG
jgi:uncharacterized protein (UPF0548 family)